jgi:hypothetical protein
MTAPVATARVTPTSTLNRLDDGYQALLTFASNPDVKFWEKTTGGPGVDGGPAIETTTQHNTLWRTFQPRALKTLTPFDVIGAIDPDMYSTDELSALINVKDTITVTFPDGSTLAFYGFLQRISEPAMVEGEQPEVTLTIVPTNTDPTTGDEEPPVMVELPGT